MVLVFVIPKQSNCSKITTRCWKGTCTCVYDKNVVVIRGVMMQRAEASSILDMHYNYY
jgi:hypothetical protein